MLSIYKSETDKIKPKIQKYLNGKIIDIGCGGDKITPDSYGVDCRPLPGVNLVVRFLNNLSNLIPDLFDVVYSSHCLEHMADDVACLKDWLESIKPGGLLILYLPDIRHYHEFNPEHFQAYAYEEFMRKMKANFPNIQEVESGMDLGREKYSFYCVFKKPVA